VISPDALNTSQSLCPDSAASCKQIEDNAKEFAVKDWDENPNNAIKQCGTLTACSSNGAVLLASESDEIGKIGLCNMLRDKVDDSWGGPCCTSHLGRDFTAFFTGLPMTLIEELSPVSLDTGPETCDTDTAKGTQCECPEAPQTPDSKSGTIVGTLVALLVFCCASCCFCGRARRDDDEPKPMPAGMGVKLHGLVTVPHLNGQSGIVAAKLRTQQEAYAVVMGNGETCNVCRANMALQPAQLPPGSSVELTGILSLPHLNGTEGTVIRKLSAVKMGEVYEVRMGCGKLHNVDRLNLVEPKFAGATELPTGARVQLTGIAIAHHLNGAIGTIARKLDMKRPVYEVVTDMGECHNVSRGNLRRMPVPAASGTMVQIKPDISQL
jgi:hypothetical protein